MYVKFSFVRKNMTLNYFFGYGSLVNQKTHRFGPAHRASVSGWQRAWRYTAQRKVSFLTVIPNSASAIDGLIAPVPDQDWQALDTREHAYDRLHVTEHVQHAAQDAATVALYAIPQKRLSVPDARHPVLLSYLDVVVQGYLQEFGLAGAEHFFDTTTGWDAPILDDRAAPVYPRAQTLRPTEQACVDAMLNAYGCNRIMPGDQTA